MLESLENVVFIGSVSREEGSAYTMAFDVGLVPFIPCPMNDAINPVKMYMYLVAGKPVVSTNIRECVSNSRLVMAARTYEEFAEMIRKAVEVDNEISRQERIRFGLANRWEDRATAAMGIIQNEGLFD